MNDQTDEIDKYSEHADAVPSNEAITPPVCERETCPRATKIL